MSIKNLFTIALLIAFPLQLAAIDHQVWDQLVSKHVRANGDVNYKGFLQDKDQLEKYLESLSQNPPQSGDSKEEKLAYWINAYNAFTIKLIIDNYPLESIQDLHPTIKIPGVSTVWHKDFFSIGGEEMSLHHIEHKILRKDFDEPRIHFAINCASISCPKLREEAYTATKLEQQLDDQARFFINNPQKNRIKENEIEISKIFQWFTGDFTNNMGLIEYLNQYSEITIHEDADIDYMEYDWGLNDASSS